jgi:hypothetical protein
MRIRNGATRLKKTKPHSLRARTANTFFAVRSDIYIFAASVVLLEQLVSKKQNHTRCEKNKIHISEHYQEAVGSGFLALEHTRAKQGL